VPIKSVMTRYLTTALAACALLGAAAGPAAAGATISLTQAKATAKRAGADAAKQTGGKNPQVMSCKRTSSRRALCKVKLHYSSGASTCVLDVKVAFKNRTSTKLVYSFGQTVCS
jgi:hypothetical protein